MLLFGAHVWRGESGRRYRFDIALTKRELPLDGGIYVFVRRRFVFLLEALYVGKAHGLTARLVGHEKWGRAYWYYGATERHVLVVRTETERRRIEEDLIRGLKPRMNLQLVPNSAKDAPKDATLRRKWRWRQWWRGALSVAGR